MEVRHLAYFVAVAEAGSFTRAAEQRYVSQSALSEQIARLEAELGSPLFDRGARRVELTGAGELLLPLARRVLSGVERAREEMRALTTLRSGRLRFGILQASSGTVDIVELLGEYRRRHPAIELVVRSVASTDMASAVGHGELDLAIVGMHPERLPAALTYEPIFDDPFVAVVGRETGRCLRSPVELAELLAAGPFIHFMAGSGIRTAVEAAAAGAGLRVDASFELDRVSTMLRLVAAGAGVTLLPSTIARRAVVDGRGFELSLIGLADERLVHPVGLVFDAARLSPAATAMIDIVRGREEC